MTREETIAEINDRWGRVVNEVTEVTITPKKTDVFVSLFGVALPALTPGAPATVAVARVLTRPPTSSASLRSIVSPRSSRVDAASS